MIGRQLSAIGVAEPSGSAVGAGPRLPALAVILLAGAAVRVLFWVALRDQPLCIWDEQEYDAIARTLAASGEYAFTPGGPPTSLRPPLYPVLVATVYSVAGVGNLAAVRLLQTVLGLITTALVYSLARSVASPKAAAAAAAMFCFYPSFLGYGNLLLTEVLFTLLLTATCVAAVRALQGGSAGWALAAGLALGLAALTRSVVWLAPPFLAGYLLLTLRAGWGRGLVSAAALVAGFTAVVAPWALRNTRLHQTFIAIDTMGGRNLLMGNYRHTPFFRSWDAISLEGSLSWEREVFDVFPAEERVTQGQVDKLALRQGLQFIRSNPGLTLCRDAVKFLDFWGLERELVAGAKRGFFGPLSNAAVVGLAVCICGGYVAVLFLAIFGATVKPLADRRVQWLLLAVVAFICALHTLTFGHSRYHLPLVPILAVFAGVAAADAGSIWRQRAKLRFLLASGLCAALVAGWIWLFVAVDWSLLTAV